MMQQIRQLAAIAATLGALAHSPARADWYRVSQIDPSSGEHVVLACVEGFATDEPMAEYYNFTSGNPSFTDPAPPLGSDRSHLFVVESSVDGVGLAFVHDEQGDGSGGAAETRFEVSGDPNGMAWLVQDGPPPNDAYTGNPGDAVFTAAHSWPGRNSDGGILGALDGGWSVEMRFTDLFSTGGEIVGLTSWKAFSADGGEIELALAPDLPVRIDPLCDGCAAPITGEPLSATPEVAVPGTIHFSLDAGAAHAGEIYFLLGSLSGTSPGIPVPPFVLPLNPDSYMGLVGANAGSGIFASFLGALDGDGRACAELAVPSPSPAELSVHHAFLVFDPLDGSIEFASNAALSVVQ